MNELSFEGANHGTLAGITGALDAGCHVVVGSERDGTSTLVMLAAGLLRPASGRVTLNGASVASSTRLRRRIASLCASETLLPGRDVMSSVELALLARGDARSASSVLAAAGLEAWATRTVHALSAAEARAVALAIALTHSEPQLVVLHEPLSVSALMNADFVLESLQRLARSGAVVLCSASRWADAARLGGETSTLERGIWLGSMADRAALGLTTLRVQTPEPQRLQDCLTGAAGVSEVRPGREHELLVRGRELEALAQSVVGLARAAGISIAALVPEQPPLEGLAAARGGLFASHVEGTP